MKKFLSLAMIAALFLTACGKRDTTYDAFASCLADEGAVFYGAFWCPNCANQKEMFGDSEDLLPYVECAQGGKDSQVQLCLDEGVESYPDWRFTDGTQLVGTQSFESLSEKTDCSIEDGSTANTDSIMLQAPAEEVTD